MAQCEMCGADTSTPNTVKVEGAEIDVCDDCADFGTEVRTQQSSSSSTKYSTSGSGGSGGSSSDASGSAARSSSSGAGSSGSSSSSGGGGRRNDMFDDMDEVAQDYDQRIRTAREGAGLSQEELANSINEKASLVRKLERGETLPSDSMQRKLESELDIDLTEHGAAGGDTDWESDDAGGSMTLGDKLERKDS